MSDLEKYYGSTPWWRPRSRPIEITILTYDPTELKFRISGDVHTLLNPLRVELSKDEDVSFVAYKIEHPLKESAIFTIKTREGDPLEALKRAINRIKRVLNDARNSFELALNKGVQNPPFTDAITWKRFLEDKENS